MIAKFIANDGKEFFSESECLKHEIETYQNTQSDRPMRARANEVIHWFDEKCSRKQMNDLSLAEIGKPMRYDGSVPIMGDFSYGIIYLRDDMIDVLVQRIRNLEAEVERLKDSRA